MIIYKPFLTSLLSVALLAGCANDLQGPYSPNQSYLKDEVKSKAVVNTTAIGSSRNNSGGNEAGKQAGMSYLSPLKVQQADNKQGVDLTLKFSDADKVQLTADDLPLKDFLHYVMGELLGVSYILGEEVKTDSKTVTLNLQEDLSKRKLYTVSEDILTERGYVIRFDDGIYYIHKEETSGSQGSVTYGYGNQPEDVPNTSLEIIQMVPFQFGLQSQLSRVLSTIAKVKITVDSAHNALIVRGKRREVIKALEFITLMDQPGFRDRQIGVYKTTFVSTEEMKLKLPELLAQEGLSVSGERQTGKAVSIVTLDRIGTVVFFANSRLVLDRVNFWAEKIDQPASGNEMQYFLYPPQFSRATDLGQSLQLLIGGGKGLGSSASASSQNKQTSSSQSGRSQSSSTITASSEGMKLVVDERANSLIFQTTGERYRQLLPLIKRLDVMPKQVILEVMIAEVTLTDEFKQGVEFALSSGNYNLTTSGSFGVEDFGGLGYTLTGSNGKLAVSLFQSNSLVNILSRPSLVVRDGVEANINVGNDIPIIGSTTQDPVSGDRETTQVDYRKTGVELGVTPTINAQGVVIMEIDQKISNQIEGGSTVANSPSFFERTIKTEVVAMSGQTVILGGLMSENRSKVNTRVPILADLPILGELFQADTDSGDKTELVVLVTPRIIETSDEWNDIKNQFESNLTEINLNQ